MSRAEASRGADLPVLVPLALPVGEWLDKSVKEAFGAKFGSAFTEQEINDTSDFADVDDEIRGDLESALKAGGAKKVEEKRIMAAFLAAQQGGSDRANDVAVVPIAKWLDSSVKEGYGELHQGTFKSVGITDTGDFAFVDLI